MSECSCDDIIIEVNEEGIDGVGIASIELLSTVGITKNYRINLTNGTHFDYSISDGSSIASISKTSSVGLVDTYTVLLTSGDTSTFEVTNGNGIASIVKTSTDNLTDTYTISYTNGTTSTFSVVNGNSIASVSKVSTQVLTDTYQITYTDEDKSPDSFTVVNGRGITSIAKTSTSGLVDTYTVTYNDNSTSTFTVTNGEKGDKGDTGDTGNGIASIALLSESGFVKTYRITMTDGTHFDFNVTDGEKGDMGETGATGNGIASIEKTSTVGLVDTYTITMTDGTTTTFTVTNGSDEWGAIVGNLSDQTDLQNALDSKAPAITETASGSIASFSDGSPAPVTALSVNIEPVQDLNGYDNPWPAEAKGNLLPSPTAQTLTSNGITVKTDGLGTYTLSGTSTNNTDFFFSIPEITLPSDGYTHIMNYGTTTANANITYYYNNTAVGVGMVFSANNRILSLGENRVGKTINKVCIHLDSNKTVNITLSPMVMVTDTVSDFYPYSNICPISGWDTATVTRTGKNLLDPTKLLTMQSGTYVASRGYTTTGEIPVKPNTTYTLSIDTPTSGGDSAIYAFDSQNTRTKISGTFRLSNTFTTPSDCRSISFYAKLNTAVSTPSEAHPQLELGSSATDYEAPSIQTVTIDLDGTRYGGTLDVPTGEMTVDRVCKTLTTARRISTTYPGSIIYNNQNPETSDADISKPLICNRLKYAGNNSWNFVYGTCINASGQSFNLWISDTAFANVDEATAWLQSNETQVCYYLATPLTVQLSPSQMQTLLGENNIWADTGDVSVTYRADTKLFIQEQIAESQRATRSLIAEIETEMVASKNYSTGDLLIVGDTLYKTTANIGSGSAITVGTNVAVTTVAEQLIALANA